MKKIFSFLLPVTMTASVILSANLIFTNLATVAAVEIIPTETANMKVLMNFNTSREFPNTEVERGTNLIHEVANPLLGGASLKVQISVEDSETYMSYTGGKISPANYKGIVYRLKTNCDEKSWMRARFEDPGKAFYYMGDGVKFFNMLGENVTPESHTLPGYKGRTYTGFSLPANFDGYVFVPFTGKNNAITGATTYDLNGSYNFQIGFVNHQTEFIHSLNGKSIVMDNVCLYKTLDYANIMADINLDIPKPNTVTAEIDPPADLPPPVDPGIPDGSIKKILDFENSASFTPSENTITITNEKKHPLIGTGSALATMAVPSGDEQGIWSSTFKGSSGYRGIVVRIKTNVSSKAMLRFWWNNSKDTYSLGKGAKFINIYGEDVTPKTLSDADGYAAVFTVANFDGYIFYPFFGKDWWGKTKMDPALDAKVWFGFVDRYTAWHRIKFAVDEISYYKGETIDDYKKAIVNLGGKVLVRGADAGDLLTNVQYGVTIEDMFGAAIPNGAALALEKLVPTDAQIQSIKEYGEDATIDSIYMIGLSDTMFYDEIKPAGKAMRLVFNLPTGTDLSAYGVCMVNDDGTITQYDVETEDGENYIVINTITLGKFAIVQKFIPVVLPTSTVTPTTYPNSSENSDEQVNTNDNSQSTNLLLFISTSLILLFMVIKINKKTEEST